MLEKIVLNPALENMIFRNRNEFRLRETVIMRRSVGFLNRTAL